MQKARIIMFLPCHLKTNVQQHKPHHYEYIQEKEFFTTILRLLDLQKGGSNLWLSSADDSLADLRIFQRLKCKCLDSQNPLKLQKHQTHFPLPHIPKMAINHFSILARYTIFNIQSIEQLLVAHHQLSILANKIKVYPLAFA